MKVFDDVDMFRVKNSRNSEFRNGFDDVDMLRGRVCLEYAISKNI